MFKLFIADKRHNLINDFIICETLNPIHIGEALRKGKYIKDAIKIYVEVSTDNLGANSFIFEQAKREDESRQGELFDTREFIDPDRLALNDTIEAIKEITEAYKERVRKESEYLDSRLKGLSSMTEEAKEKIIKADWSVRYKDVISFVLKSDDAENEGLNKNAPRARKAPLQKVNISLLQEKLNAEKLYHVLMYDEGNYTMRIEGLRPDSSHIVKRILQEAGFKEFNKGETYGMETEKHYYNIILYNTVKKFY